MDEALVLPPCNKKIFEDGEVMFVTHTIPAHQVEEWVKAVSLVSNQPVDWYYVGGRSVVRAMGDLDAVNRAIAILMPLHDILFKIANED